MIALVLVFGLVFEGATGTVQLDPLTGSRLPTTAIFRMTNILEVPVNDTHVTYEPQDSDVLFGKGRKKHPGNIVLRDVMSKMERQYESSTKRRKMEITCVIVQSMSWSGARFLEQHPQNGHWVEVPYIQAHRKVAKTFRNRRRFK